MYFSDSLPVSGHPHPAFSRSTAVLRFIFGRGFQGAMSPTLTFRQFPDCRENRKQELWKDKVGPTILLKTGSRALQTKWLGFP